jgi:hypothetical protein
LRLKKGASGFPGTWLSDNGKMTHAEMDELIAFLEKRIRDFEMNDLYAEVF